MKKINLLGMNLKDRYTRESLALAERFLKERAVHIMLYLTTPVLLEAAENEDKKEWIESADAVLWGDSHVLETAGITVKGRRHEVENREFLKNFLRRMAKTHKSILVMSNTDEQAQSLKEELIKMQEGVTIAGTMVIRDIDNDMEVLINEINMVAPAVMIARMPYDIQQKWLTLGRQYMNVGIWIGMPEDFSCINKREMPVEKMSRRILDVLLSRKVNKYKK